MVEWRCPNKARAVWRRWPAYNGSGILAMPPDHALHCLREGSLTMDGLRAKVLKVDGIDELDGNLISVVLQFDQGAWGRPHP